MRTLSAFIAISSLLLGIASIATLIGRCWRCSYSSRCSCSGLAESSPGSTTVKCVSTTSR